MAGLIEIRARRNRFSGINRVALGILGLCLALSLGACATTSSPKPSQTPQTNVSTPGAIDAPVIEATPDPKPAPELTAPPPTPAPPPADTPPPEINLPAGDSPLTQLPYWSDGDHLPAFTAFQRSCKSWANAKPEAQINKFLPDYGMFSDWRATCDLASDLPRTAFSAAQFFENQFVPVSLKGNGLITGYYQPEIDVRRIPDAVFFEPILSKPKTKAIKNQPRSQISAKTSRVIAYGRPMDVFFMQIQGSGHIRFKDGRTIRAAYGGNNGYAYRSIGRVLIQRGALTKDRSSKRDIEAWMAKAGPVKARALMNENKRYIYFTEQAIKSGEGPVGAMRVPLTGMGSMAVDPRYHPYGIPVYLTVKLPHKGGDYKGKTVGQLLIAQDTGSAIKGALRGDLYFGSGAEAGRLAGVMKHRAKWTVLLPKALAEKRAPVS